MIYRNLAAMETEELIRAQPMDAVILVGGCDKTVPAQVMGGLSAGRPMLATVSGAMYAGRRDGERIGACTDCRRLWGQHRAGELEDDELAFAQGELAPTAGTCSVMGTASTMACVTEALGLMLAGVLRRRHPRRRACVTASPPDAQQSPWHSQESLPAS